MSTINNHQCVNCEQLAPENFCPNCGQKQGVERLTWTSVFSELQKRWFGFDNNFLRTVKDLSIHPKRVISASIEGVRVRYIGPVGYYFLLVTLYVIILNMFDIDLSEYATDFNSSINPEMNADQVELTRKANQFVAENFRVISFLMIPFFVSGLWIVFKNKGYNFLETSVLTFYGQGHPIWFSIVFLVVNKFTGNNMSILIISAVTFLYAILVATFFYKGNKVWNFIKATFALALGFVLMMVSAGAVGIVIGILKGMGKM